MDSFINVPTKCFSSQEEKEQSPRYLQAHFIQTALVQEYLRRRHFLANFCILVTNLWEAILNPNIILSSQPFAVCFYVQQASHSALPLSPQLTVASTEDTYKLCT